MVQEPVLGIQTLADDGQAAVMAERLTELAEQARQGSLLGITFIVLTDQGAFRTGAEGIFASSGMSCANISRAL